MHSRQRETFMRHVSPLRPPLCTTIMTSAASKEDHAHCALTRDTLRGPVPTWCSSGPGGLAAAFELAAGPFSQ